jgi:amidophosphoribosyltransferase
MASAAPPVRYPNVYGIDMPSAQELVAHGHNVEEIAANIGADKLIYQDLEDLLESAREGNPGVEQFECSVFTGEYITGDVDAQYLHQLASARNDSAKSAKDSQLRLDVVGLHNGDAGNQ